ncbi:MAG: ROK family protein [Bauldia sp.]|nr:ROK family protein [Bauldia sp.]
MSRADLARELGLNRSSSGQIVYQLTESGLVQEVEGRDEQAKVGRPGILLALVPEAAFFVGVEIGVEHVTAVRIDLCAQVLSRRTSLFDARAASIEEAVRLAVRLGFDGVEPDMMNRCKGVGISAPAHISAGGFVRLAPLIGWKNIDLAQIVRREVPVPVPVAVENDANAFAIGDGYKRGRSGVTLFLNMETGVGGGILIDGKLFRGGHGLAGEIGHVLVPGGNGQELERLIGRERLVTQYREATGRDDLDFSAFLGDVRDRVPVAVSIAEGWSRHLAYALQQVCRLIDPDRIVLGGSVALLYPMVAARVSAHLAEGQTIAFPAPVIAVDEDAELGSAFGAACLLHQRFLSLENEDFRADDGTSGRAPASAVRRTGLRENELQ